MKRIRVLAFLSIVISLFSHSCSRESESGSQEQRIVSLVPSVTETIYLLGAQAMLVGVSDIDSAYGKPVVGSMIKPDYEKLLSLKPTLVILTMPMQRKVKEELDKMGIRTMEVNPESIDQILHSIIRIGQITGREERARFVVDSLKGEMKRVLSGRKYHYTTFVELWLDPIYTAGDSTFINDIISRIGLRNVFSDRAGYFQVQQEEVIKRNPQLIIISHPRVKPPQEREFWGEVDAVKHGRIIYVNPDLFNRPGPGFVRAMEELVEKLDSLETVPIN